MDSKNEVQKKVFMAARDQGISSVLFRNAIGRKLGLTITDSECLSLLTIKGVSTPTELARYTGLTSGSATAMLDRLEKAKFIKRMPNPNDRRGVLIEINKETGETTKKLVAGIQQAHKKLLENYTKKELEIIADFLSRFTENIKDHTKILEDK